MVLCRSCARARRGSQRGNRQQRDSEAGTASRRRRDHHEGRVRRRIDTVQVLPMNVVKNRVEAQERYRELPLPDTTEEHWRFTDLKGFDPDSFGHDRGQSPAVAPTGMLDLDVAGLATITEAGIEIEHAPEGVTFAPLTEEYERLYSLVGWDEKFAAHNAAIWKHGLLGHVHEGVTRGKPLYLRIANSVADGSLFWRLLVIADPGARFTVVEEAVPSSPDPHAST